MDYIHFHSFNLQNFVDPFSVMAISENIDSFQEKEINFEIDDFDLHYVKRQNKTGGGVALYVHKTIKYLIRISLLYLFEWDSVH